MRHFRTSLTLALLVVFALAAGTSHAAVAVSLIARAAGSAAGERGASDGAADAARFNYPVGIDLSADAAFALVADAQNNTIRRFDLASGQVTTLAGAAGQRGEADGTGTAARFAYPSDIAISTSGSFALVTDTDNHTIRTINLATGSVTTLAGAPGSRGSADGSGAAARFAFPSALALSPDASYALVADTDNHVIRRVDVATGAVTTFAGSAGLKGSTDGTGALARFASPRGVAFSQDGRFALVADSDNHTLRRIDMASGAVTTLAGSAGNQGSADGVRAEARFAFPRGISMSGDFALVADFSNSTLRRVDLATGAVSTMFGLAGSPGRADGVGAAARLNFPAGITTAGGVTLVADTYNHSLRRITAATLQERVYAPLVAR